MSDATLVPVDQDARTYGTDPRHHVVLEANVQAIVIGGVLWGPSGILDLRIRDDSAAGGGSLTNLLNATGRFRLSRMTSLAQTALKDLAVGDVVWITDPTVSGQNLQVWNGTQWKAVQLA